MADCGHQIHYKRVQKWMNSHAIQMKFGGIKVLKRAEADNETGGMPAYSYELNPCDSHAFAQFGKECFERLEASMDKDGQSTHYSKEIEMERMQRIGKRVWTSRKFHKECRKHIKKLEKTLKRIKKAGGGRISRD